MFSLLSRCILIDVNEPTVTSTAMISTSSTVSVGATCPLERLGEFWKFCSYQRNSRLSSLRPRYSRKIGAQRERRGSRFGFSNSRPLQTSKRHGPFLVGAMNSRAIGMVIWLLTSTIHIVCCLGQQSLRRSKSLMVVLIGPKWTASLCPK